MKTRRQHHIIMFSLFVAACLPVSGRAQMETVRPETMYAASHALVIGVSDYDRWPSLRGVRMDVPEVERALQSLGFETHVRMNPRNREELEQAFRDFIDEYGSRDQHRDSRLLFYFAGHGDTIRYDCDDEMGTGYIVASDAPLVEKQPCSDRYLDANGRPRKIVTRTGEFVDYAVNMDTISAYAKNIRAKHVLFVFDSCFAGTIFTILREPPAHISNMTAKPVRQFITSGSGDETVPDKSAFRRHFVDALLNGTGDVDGDGYITGGELGWYLEKRVTTSTQHPQYGKMPNPAYNKGDFVFILPNQPPTPAPPPTPTPESPDCLLALADLEEAFLQAQAQDGRTISTDTKIAFWQRALAYCVSDLTCSAKDNDLCRQTQERLDYWQNFREPTPTPEPTATPATPHQLRRQPGTYSLDEIKQMVKTKGFRDSSWNPQGDFPNEFESKTVNGDRVVVDHATGLMWQQGGSSEYMVWEKAQGYVDQLNRERYAGFSDWRLPTIEELASLLESTEQNGDLYISPEFDKSQRWCWSIDKRSSESAWHVNFNGGSVYNLSEGGFRYVRAVRP